ncbi:MAG: cytochrome c, partial [Acidimicrobiia bacterium]
MDELLKKVAEIRGMPASLVERSAQARAEKTGASLEAVLKEWAGEGNDKSETGTSEAETPEVPRSEPSKQVTDEPAAEASENIQEAGESVSTDDLVRLAAEAKRMPPKLILSSAQARATHAGSTLEAVLAEWAGVNLDDLDAPAAPRAPEEAAPSEDTETTKASTEESDENSIEQPDGAEGVPPAAAATAAVAAAMSMDELLEKVAEVKGMPASLAKRSAEAKAKKTGEPLEAVLAEWAGVDVANVSASPPGPAGDGEADEVPSPEPPTDSPADASEEAPSEGVEIIEPTGAAQDDEGTGEAEIIDEVPARAGGYPKWLAAAFLLIPLLAVTYLMVSPNGPDCGSGGQLLIDPVTGEATNCDGSEYGQTTADYFAAGGAIYAQCAACHSADGTGGVGPSFASGAVLETFPIGQCTTQIEWVGIGTAGWPDPTYGANEKPVGGVGLMPGFGNSLSEQQLAEVALFERVQFGGQE